MRVVVDTNVLAYHLLGTPRFAAEAGKPLGAADEIPAPALWEAELANVVWLAARTGVLPESEAPARLSLATFDRRLAKAFPAVAKRPGEVVLE